MGRSSNKPSPERLFMNSLSLVGGPGNGTNGLFPRVWPIVGNSGDSYFREVLLSFIQNHDPAQIARIVRIKTLFQSGVEAGQLAGKDVRRQARHFRQVEIQFDQEDRTRPGRACPPDWQPPASFRPDP